MIDGISQQQVKKAATPQWPQAALLAIVALLNLGFVRTPISHWTQGKVEAIDPARHVLTLRGNSGRFVWNKQTRFWVAPARQRDRGVAFDSAKLEVGAEVRVMFKQNRKETLATRVIQLSAIPAHARNPPKK